MSGSASDTLNSVYEGIDEVQASIPRFSVLMAVYHADNPIFFDQSLRSVFAQTLPPSQVVLVCDGVLPDRLEHVIQKYIDEYSGELQVVRTSSPRNEGLGKALALGLSHCKYSLVARMDSDDISMPHRFERQIGYMVQHPEVDMLSCTIVEFADTPERPIGYRRFKTSHEYLSRQARCRNPINHPAVVFRRERIQQAGGYIHFPLLEDYHLIARLLMNGGRLASLRDPLLYFRVAQATYERRRGWHYLRSEIELQRYFLRIGFVSPSRYLSNILIRIPVRILPSWGLKRVYRFFFRSTTLER
ncbi:MAG: glycosyltransferase [Porphyromonadaceae bacterium]|nr:glycosyltransferase [Porphyromonadaceae bacterium]